MSPKGKMIFVAILVLLIGGVFVLKQNKETPLQANGEQTGGEALPVFIDIITPT